MIEALTFSAKSRYLVTSSSTEIQVWDVTSGRELAARNQVIKPGWPWCRMAFTGSDSRILISIPDSKTLL